METEKKLFTTGYEITTAATNLFNAVITAILTWKMIHFVKPDLRKVLWGITFLLFFLVCVFGAAVHGFVMTLEENIILWRYLYAVMSVMVASFTCAVVYEADGPSDIKRTVIIAAVLAGVFLVLRVILEVRYHIGFLAFTCYSAGSFLFCAVKLLSVRKKKPYVNYILAGIASLVIGSILQTMKGIKFHFIFDFDYNAVYHLFTLFLVLFVYKGLKESSNGSAD